MQAGLDSTLLAKTANPPFRVIIEISWVKTRMAVRAKHIMIAIKKTVFIIFLIESIPYLLAVDKGKNSHCD